MSTGQELHIEINGQSFEAINAYISGLDLASLSGFSVLQELPAGQEKPTCQENPASQERPAGQETPASRTQRLVMSYAAARPILVALAAIQFIPTSWRAVLAVFTTTLDEVSASFRFGTSDAPVSVQPGATASMEPKLPVG